MYRDRGCVDQMLVDEIHEKLNKVEDQSQAETWTVHENGHDHVK